MSSKLELYSGVDACGKLIEYANVLRSEGYNTSQIWQNDEDYENIGINFSIGDRGEFIILERVNQHDINIEIDCNQDGDTDMLIQLYHLIKNKETK